MTVHPDGAGHNTEGWGNLEFLDDMDSQRLKEVILLMVRKVTNLEAELRRDRASRDVGAIDIQRVVTWTSAVQSEAGRMMLRSKCAVSFNESGLQNGDPNAFHVREGLTAFDNLDLGFRMCRDGAAPDSTAMELLHKNVVTLQAIKLGSLGLGARRHYEDKAKRMAWTKFSAEWQVRIEGDARAVAASDLKAKEAKEAKPAPPPPHHQHRSNPYPQRRPIQLFNNRGPRQAGK